MDIELIFYLEILQVDKDVYRVARVVLIQQKKLPFIFMSLQIQKTYQQLGMVLQMIFQKGIKLIFEHLKKIISNINI